MILQVTLKERISEFDFREWSLPVTCGHGMQPLRWLGHAACSHMAFCTGDVPAKYVPQAVRSPDGKVVYHPDLRINQVFQDGGQVEIECSKGPDSFTAHWEGKPPPIVKDFFPKEEEKDPEEENEEAKPSEVAAAAGAPQPSQAAQTAQTGTTDAPAGTPSQDVVPVMLDADGNPIPVEPPPPPPPPPDKRVVWATDALASIDWSIYSFGEDLNTNYETWEKDCGVLQSVFIWYCAKGDEIEDKDFGVLNFEQFRQIFVDAKLCCDDDAAEKVVKQCFEQGLIVRGSKAAYQLTFLEFTPAVVQFAASPVFEPMVPDRDKQHLSTRVTLFVRNVLVPCLTEQLGAELQELHKAATTGTVCMDVLRENKELFQACIKRCKPPSDPSETKIRVPFRILLPYLRRWLVLGHHWKPQRASLIVIYAFQKSQHVSEFTPIPPGFSFGPKQLRKCLFGASYFAFMESTSLIKISDHAYLRDFLDKVFRRAGVAKPLYTTYEEKKAYLRSLLLNE